MFSSIILLCNVKMQDNIFLSNSTCQLQFVDTQLSMLQSAIHTSTTPYATSVKCWMQLLLSCQKSTWKTSESGGEMLLLPLFLNKHPSSTWYTLIQGIHTIFFKFHKYYSPLVKLTGLEGALDAYFIPVSKWYTLSPFLVCLSPLKEKDHHIF